MTPRVMMSKLHKQGFVLLEKGIKISRKLTETIKAEHPRGDVIFNFNEKASKSDRKRSQVNLKVTNPGGMELNNKISALVNKLFKKKLKQTDTVVLNSSAGCQAQAAHCDYIPDELLAKCPKNKIPLGMIISLEEHTKLTVWPKSHQLVKAVYTPHEERLTAFETILPVELQTKKGDVIFFRGDLVHAGSSYDKPNTRVHAYLDSDAIERKPNQTFIICKHADKMLRDAIVPVVQNSETKQSKVKP